MANTFVADKFVQSAWLLDKHELHVLSAYGRVQAYRKNTVIVREGEAANAIFIIRSGKVKVFLRNKVGKEIILNIHGPGEYFGEMGLDEGARSASVSTLEASREMISRIFKDLIAGGYISVTNRQITINRDLPRRW